MDNTNTTEPMTKQPKKPKSKGRKIMLFILIPLLILLSVVLFSQWQAHTPPILGESGQQLPNSITSLEKVDLGGVNQWLIIRGQDMSNPVLIFLSGGPGASESGRVSALQ